jgi:phosphoesterase RecJ-like protein
MNTVNGSVAELAPRILELVRSSKKILLHLHPVPGGDSIGSTLAMWNALGEMGKDVTLISGDSPTPADFSSLPGFEHITPLSFPEVDLSEYDLFLILDTGGPDKVTTKTSIVFPPHLRTVLIDHHMQNKQFTEIILVDSNAPATAKILYELFSAWNLPISEAVAICLFVGIYYDTMALTIPRTSTRELEILTELSRAAPRFSKTLFSIDNNRPERLTSADMWR